MSDEAISFFIVCPVNSLRRYIVDANAYADHCYTLAPHPNLNTAAAFTYATTFGSVG